MAYADDATLFASVPSPHMKSFIAESLNRDLAKISARCKLWGTKMNPTKTQCTTVSRSRTAFLPLPDLFIGDVPLTLCGSFKILGVIFDNRFTFEQHLCLVSSVAQKICLLRKSFKVFGDQLILQKCFNFFILPCVEYCSPVWCSAADSHLGLLDRNLNAIRFLIHGLSVDLRHQHSISSLCMLFKIFHTPKHLYSDLRGLFCPFRIIKGVLSFNNLAFSHGRLNTTQFFRSFVPAVTRLWNDLPNHVVESVQLQNFKCGANTLLLNRLF